MYSIRLTKKTSLVFPRSIAERDIGAISSRPFSFSVDSVNDGVPSVTFMVQTVRRKLNLLDAGTLVVATTSLSGRKEVVRTANHNHHMNQ